MDCLTYNVGSINLNAFSNQTKLDALKTFLRLMELDIVLLQEVYGQNLNFVGYNVIYNVDHMRRGTAIMLKENI